MQMETLSLEVRPDSGAGTLTLLTRRGAFTPQLWRELGDLLEGSELEGVRALVIRGPDAGGAGDFSVGLDLRASAGGLAGAVGDRERFRALVAPMQRAVEGVAALPMPTIAAVSGWCIGAGLELAAACDLRLASADARFSLPEVRLGLVADLGGLQRLPPLVGRGWAARLALSGEAIDAATAGRIGLVTDVLDSPEALFARADELARLLGGLDPQALAGTRQVLNDGLPHAESLMNAVDWNADHLDLERMQARVAATLKR